MICMIWLMLPGGTRIIYMISHVFPGLDLYYADPAQPLTKPGEELDYSFNSSYLSAPGTT